MSTGSCGRNFLKQIENKRFTYYLIEKVKNTNEKDKNQTSATLV